MARAQSKEVLAVIGGNGFFGRRLLPDLCQSARYKKVVVLDKKRPEGLPPDAVYYKVDITQPTADTILVDIFRSEQVSSVLHLAFHSRPSTNAGDGHELEVIGTFNLLNAVAATGIEQVVLPSSTLAYGARPLNPNYMDESKPLQARKSYRYMADRVEVEKLVSRFRGRHKNTVITVLRLAPVIGPTIRNHDTSYLSMPITLSLFGYDPLLQVLHESDAIDAFRLALESRYNGALNIVPQDVLPLSTMLYLAGKFNTPVPYHVAYPMVGAAWLARLSPVPAEHLDYIRYLCCGDGELAQKEIGFEARLGCRETIASFSEVQRLRRVNLSTSPAT